MDVNNDPCSPPAPQAPPLNSSPNAATALHVCLVCNLCCDGSFFARVAVTSEERARLRDVGNFFTKPHGELRMRLACSYLGKDGACQCYESRPGDCRTYRCNLLKSVDRGITTMAAAVQIAREARALRNRAWQAAGEALVAGGDAPPEATEDIDHIIDRLEDLSGLRAPIPAPALDLAKYRYRCYVEFIRLYFRCNHRASTTFA